MTCLTDRFILAEEEAFCSKDLYRQEYGIDQMIIDEASCHESNYHEVEEVDF